MSREENFSYIVGSLYKLVKVMVLFLLIMGLARVYLLLTYGASAEYSWSDLVATFWIGTRLDLSIVAYITILPLLLSIIGTLLNNKKVTKTIEKLTKYYLLFMVSLVSIFIFADSAYYSFFGTHATLMIFGIVDDDTKALFEIALKNYNLAAVFAVSLLYAVVIYKIIATIYKTKKSFLLSWKPLKQILFFSLLVVIVAGLGRGSLGVFPLAKTIPDVSADPFINRLPLNASFAMIRSFKEYKKSKSGKYDLIKKVGYAGRIEKAFEVYMQSKEINKTDLLANLQKTTPYNKAIAEKKPNVVVVMAESFGLPLLTYQSKSFNIMGAVEKNFKEDTLFTNFISASNGTIISLEPVLLNITARPASTSFAQSKYLNTEFRQASARVYENAGYDTTFIYAGDLSWRNVGNFMLHQGFKQTVGRAKIAKALGRNADEISGEYGIFDGYTYQYILNKLKNSKKPQFIYVLTTNNHPPFTVPKDYVSKSLVISDKLKKHLVGNMDLIKKRIKDYAYEADMAGVFLDKLKASPLKDNTVVAITADNNTVEGIMHYDNYYTTTKKIPFYLYLPPYLKPKKAINTEVASSHKDIFPTLYNLTLSESNYTSIGVNLLNDKTLHCGFNDAGVLMASDGGFKVGHAKSKIQKKCEEYYKASLAVTEYLIKSHNPK